MPRQTAYAVENNFRNGLVTEATGLNFPEAACTEAFDCVFEFDGTVRRRLGIDFESGYAEKSINRAEAAVTSYLWKNVSGDGNLTLVVMQVGGTIYFYRTDAASLSAGAVSTTITLSTYLASGAPTPNTIECQFATGNGLLFVTHPYCDPFYVSYVNDTDTATGNLITIKIRDFEGDTADTETVDSRPTATLAGLDVNHLYNLYNQGWNTTNLTAWDTSQTTMPSNADVMWRFKNSSDAFDMATLANVISGNTPAPRGHFIMTLSNQDRDAAAGTTGATDTTTSFYRPSTCAFFSGRVFYAGINYSTFVSKIYFSQIAERNDQYAKCYQQNDPTAEALFDLLPSDGGVIAIPDAGTIYKLVSIAGSLLVFSSNGVWSVTGSTGIGFTATDYSVSKISSITSTSAASFVDVGGLPAWWNSEGIYSIVAGEGSPQVKPLSFGKIKTFYDAIPTTNKLFARGFYNLVDMTVQWLFRSTVAATTEELFEFDFILVYNTLTEAWYPWRLSASDVTVNGISLLLGTSGSVSINQVINDAADTVIDDSTNNVVVYEVGSTSSALTPTFKYITSYVSGATYKFTFAEARDTTYVDWAQYDGVGVNFDSTFTSGFKLRGDAMRKFQPTYLSVYSNNDTDTSYQIRGLWDFATASSTGRWSNAQTVTHSNANYGTMKARLKMRGHGVALQFKVDSVDGSPFNIIGWSEYTTGNAVP